MNVKGGGRVVRGVDWIYKSQDGDPGHVGTVIDMTDGRFLCGPCFPPHTVLVQWDVGNKGLYRIGHDHAFELRELDIPGMVHTKVWCDGCNKPEIQGLRWRCTECYGIDLCTDCYMGDKHDIRHVFMRVRCSDRSSMGEKVPPRCSSSFSPIYGFFPGAKVVMYPSLVQRAESDNGLGKIVESTCTPEMGQECGKATVEFRDGVTSQVHCGWKGKVDIMCTSPSQGGEIYEAHLPDLGNADLIKIGDKVVLTASPEESRRLQKRRALLELKTENLGKEGVVTMRSEKGNFAINFTGCQQTVWINPFALTKLYTFCPGQTVLVSSDENLVTRFHDRVSRKDDIEEVEFELIPGLTLISSVMSCNYAADTIKVLVARGAFIEGVGGSFPTALHRAVY
ncbi:E3 ubiquitin-protein ligase MIB2-like [Diadema antillarum]|uniref:E3 ubiquitin-protein ligase MIB2-like n=1 Tax=Diadema antillarum TaxID=105358 RepID=UPI003A89AE39